MTLNIETPRPKQLKKDIMEYKWQVLPEWSGKFDMIVQDNNLQFIFHSAPKVKFQFKGIAFTEQYTVDQIVSKIILLKQKQLRFKTDHFEPDEINSLENMNDYHHVTYEKNLNQITFTPRVDSPEQSVVVPAKSIDTEVPNLEDFWRDKT